MFLPEEMKRRKTMLTIDNKIIAFGFSDKTHAFRRVRAPKAQRLVCKEQDRAWYQRLADRCFVKIYDLADLSPVKQTLK